VFNLAFMVLVFGELFRSFASRSTTRVFWSVGAFSNALLLGVVLGSVALQLALAVLPFARGVFGLGALGAGDLAACVAIGLVPVTLIELAKLVRARM
jgi:P-type Ca2+ transporter type 2C